MIVLPADGIQIGLQTEEGTVTAILLAKVWKKWEPAAKTYPHGVAALSGSLERFADGEIVLQHPALQGFEKKVRPEAPAGAPGSDSNEPAVKGSAVKAPMMTAAAALNGTRSKRRPPFRLQPPLIPSGA